MKFINTLFLILILLSSVMPQSAVHQVADANGGNFIGGNKIVGNLPKGYEDFLMLWVDYKVPQDYKINSVDDYQQLLLPDKNGKIVVGGRMVFKGKMSQYLSYEYKSAWLVEEAKNSVRLIFDTETVEGVSYRFEGTYLDKYSDSSASGKVHLEGIMTKFVNGQKMSENKFRFSPYIILE